MSEEEEKPEKIGFEDELRRYGRADPFNPFDIVVTSGDRYTVTSSDNLAFNGNTVLLAEPKTGILFFRKNQIVSVQVHDEPVKGKRNKRGRA